MTWRERPSLGSILRAIELPDNGGDTLFANMVMAHDRLSDAMKEKIDGLVAVHDIARVFAKPRQGTRRVVMKNTRHRSIRLCARTLRQKSV